MSVVKIYEVPPTSTRTALALAENERVAGFVHIGTPAEIPADRERPVPSEIVTRWKG